MKERNEFNSNGKYNNICTLEILNTVHLPPFFDNTISI